MTDLERFTKFFERYGITIEPRYGTEDEYIMDGPNVCITTQCGSTWYFDKKGRFKGVDEGS